MNPIHINVGDTIYCIHCRDQRRYTTKRVISGYIWTCDVCGHCVDSDYSYDDDLYIMPNPKDIVIYENH